MKKLIVVILFIPSFLSGQSAFDAWFENKSFRFDFQLGGNALEVNVYPQQMKQEPFWAGSLNNMIDPFEYGSYRLKIIDAESNNLIYSKGFSTLFQEWQTTAEAKKMDRIFYHCMVFPFPKKTFLLQIEARQWEGHFTAIYKTEIDPTDYFIIKEAPSEHDHFVLMENGTPHEKVDLVILAEGYTKEEADKFLSDARRVSNYLFEEEPFRSAKNSFNVRAVFTPSADSGTDIPGEGIYKNTAFNASFYTFDIDRYLTTTDMKAVHDAAATVPYDHIYVLVNSKRYGGGGIYNFLNICTAGNNQTKEVFIHEFGHGFAGLGDEYYSSSVAYEGFYNLETEPWEPNLTTLVAFGQKWKSAVHDSVPIPTPREPKYQNLVGVYEGGGYQAKGIYSPYIECRMKSNDAKGFCPVCTEAIQSVIDYHCR